MSDNLSQNILATICYDDVLDYPLTIFEIWKYLLSANSEQRTINSREQIGLADVVKALEAGELEKQIETFQGFYFLSGRKGLVAKRLTRNKLSEKKYRKIKRAVWFLRAVPFVRMIAATGRMAMKNAEKKSDLDLLIVLEKGHIFTGRILVTLTMHFLGMRRYGDKIANRICLNYFITTNSLEIEMQDLFASSEYFFTVPLFGFKYFQKFQTANGWIRNCHENYHPAEVPNLKVLADNFFSMRVRKIGEIIFGAKLLEAKLKKWETKRIINDPRTKKPGSLIVANDDSLVFLPEPQGPQIFEAFQRRLNERIN